MDCPLDYISWIYDLFKISICN